MVGGRRNGVGSLFGVVETVVVSVGSRAFGAAACDQAAPQQTERGAHPAGVEREAEGHETLLAMDTDREPHRGNNPTRSCEDTQVVVNHTFLLLRR